MLDDAHGLFEHGTKTATQRRAFVARQLYERLRLQGDLPGALVDDDDPRIFKQNIKRKGLRPMKLIGGLEEPAQR